MTAKHRKGKSNHKNEENFFKNDLVESEVRAGGSNYTLLLVLFLIVVVGGATIGWFCFQQHQTLTYLSDNLTGMQMKIVRLQSSHEEFRLTNPKQQLPGNVESRLSALEESYALAQKQVGMALATAEQLKTSDLPAQVLSLHAEMNTRLAEMQQSTVSPDRMSQLQSVLKEKSEEFEGVKLQVEGLGALSAELSHKVEVLTGSVEEAEAKLGERAGQVSVLSSTLEGQASEVLRLQELLAVYQAQLEANMEEMAAVRKLLQPEQSQQLEELLAAKDETVAAPVGEAAAPAGPEEEGAHLDSEAPAEQEDAVAQDVAPAEEDDEEEEDLATSQLTGQVDEDVPQEESVVEEAAEDETVAEEVKEDILEEAEEEEEELVNNAAEALPAEVEDEAESVEIMGHDGTSDDREDGVTMESHVDAEEDDEEVEASLQDQCE